MTSPDSDARARGCIVLHMIAPFHTIVDDRYSHCAFTGKVMRFPKMMRLASERYGPGFYVIEYSNGTSTSEAHQHVKILEESDVPECNVYRPPGSAPSVGKTKDDHAHTATIGTAHWKAFDDKVLREVVYRARAGDIVLYPFGNCHPRVVAALADCSHVESGIGYADSFAGFRVYESSAWMHRHFGRACDENGKNYHTVIPNYYDTDEWRFNSKPSRDYVLFFGRVTAQKGLEVVTEIAKRMPNVRFVICGQGNGAEWCAKSPNIEYRPPVYGKDRYPLVSNAACVVCPTLFIEPFCGVHAEANLCGVPVVTSNSGVFWETVKNGKNGFICNTLGDYLSAVCACSEMDVPHREKIAIRAAAMFGLAPCADRYSKFLKDVHNIRNGRSNPDGTNGWFIEQTNSHLLTPLQSDMLATYTLPGHVGWDENPLSSDAERGTEQPNETVLTDQ